MAERLQKFLARAGVASRRHAEGLITEGRVSVNNQVVTQLGTKVEPTDLVTVDGNLIEQPQGQSYYIFYKPPGVVTTLSDPQGRPSVGEYLQKVPSRVFPVGRLDYDAEGALLLTDDGALAHQLTHPSFEVQRSYLAKVKGIPDLATLEKLRGGIRLEDGMATPLVVDEYERAERNTWLRIVVAEGRPHLIKRLCAAVGHPVVRLFRPSHGGIGVERMRPGDLRPLHPEEVRQLHEVVSGGARAPEHLKLPARRHGRAGEQDAAARHAKLNLPEGDAEDSRPQRAAEPPRGVSSQGPRRPASGAPERGNRPGAAGPQDRGHRRPMNRSTARRPARRPDPDRPRPAPKTPRPGGRR